jgi:hypothetical protein
MSGASIPADAATAPREAVVPRAGAVVAAGLALGLLAQWLFYDTAPGMNVPVATAALLLAGWLIRPAGAQRVRWRDLWLPVAAIVLSAFVALRGDPTLVALDVLGSLALAGAALAAFAGRPVVDRPLGWLLVLAGRLAGAAAGGGGRPLGAARQALPAGQLRRTLETLGPLLRGMALAIPLVLLFTVLFASADAVFAEITGDLFDWELDLGSVPGRLVFGLAVAWLATGLLAFVVRPAAEGSERALMGAWSRRPRIGTGEVLTVLVALDLLFIGFAVLQATYLFGGRNTLAETGLTYAEYARRGFFELLAVAFGVGGLVVAAEAFVRRRSRLYVGAAIGLVLLTLVVLGSAFLRLRLYQDAYGWTELRFYVLAAIAWLAAGAMLAVATLATNRSGWLLHGMVALSLAFGLAFNVVGPVRHVAAQNVARAIHPELVAPGGRTGLDVAYLGSLGDDAAVVLAESLADLPAADRGLVADALAARADALQADEGGAAPQAWNLARERARDLLSR